MNFTVSTAKRRNAVEPYVSLWAEALQTFVQNSRSRLTCCVMSLLPFEVGMPVYAFDVLTTISLAVEANGLGT